MATKEIINHCSNVNYWSKDKIIKTYTEKCWREVSRYRDSLRTDFLLLNSANEKISFVMTPHLIVSEINIHKNINKLSRYFYNYQELLKLRPVPSIDLLLAEKIRSEVLVVMDGGYNLRVDEKSIDRILLGKQHPILPGEYFAMEYIRFLYSLNSRLLHTKISKNIGDFNAKISNLFVRNIYRQKIIIKKNVDHSMLSTRTTIDYNGFLPRQLPLRLAQLDNAFQQINTYNLFCVSVVVYYYIKFGSFFQKYNEISAIAGMYLVIAEEYSDVVALLNLGKLIITRFELLSVAYDSSASSDPCDITPLCYQFLDLINQNLTKEIKKITSKIKKIVQERDISVPLSKTEILIKAQNLCASNQYLTTRQAVFFLTHNSLSKSYTIDNFRVATNSSYETSRYSLDNLVKQGFYQKKKFKKKFIYTVTTVDK